jgi:23S rRNA (uracil1939-C5)-methyltransferase
MQPKPEKKNFRQPTCPHFVRCGGCETLDKPYERQLVDKQNVLTAIFPFIPDLPALPIIACPEPYHYRHKVQLPFGTKKQGREVRILLGCYARDSHEVVDQHTCLVQDRDLSAIAWIVREWAGRSGLSIYNEKNHTGFLRHVLLRKGAGTGEVLVGLVTNGSQPPGTRNLSTSLLKMADDALAGSGASIVGIVQNVNTRRTNVVLGEREITWWGRPFLFEKLGHYRFKLGLSTFFQVNPYQTPRLYDEVLKGIEHRPAVLDCYCGVGSISLWIAGNSRIVTGMEENGASVAAAKKAAQVNGIGNVRFFKGDVSTLLPEMQMDGYDTVIFDPPRKGLDTPVLSLLVHSPLKRIIYVSCNPETLARDVQALLPRWKLRSLQGVDLFPHTRHIECVAVLDGL